MNDALGELSATLQRTAKESTGFKFNELMLTTAGTLPSAAPSRSPPAFRPTASRPASRRCRQGGGRGG